MRRAAWIQVARVNSPAGGADLKGEWYQDGG
jgi:hypothetical protein